MHPSRMRNTYRLPVDRKRGGGGGWGLGRYLPQADDPRWSYVPWADTHEANTTQIDTPSIPHPSIPHPSIPHPFIPYPFYTPCIPHTTILHPLYTTHILYTTPTLYHTSYSVPHPTLYYLLLYHSPLPPRTLLVVNINDKKISLEVY